MKYFYLGKYKIGRETKNIYYSEEDDKFYATNLNLENKSEIVSKLFEITNTAEIEALKIFYFYKKEYDKKMQEEKIQEEIERLNFEKIIQDEDRKLNNIKCFGKIGALLVAGAISVILLKEPLNSLKLHYKNALISDAKKDEKQEEIYNKFREAISANKTISKELYNILINNFNALKSADAPLLDNQVKAIIKRLNDYDFSYINKTNYIDTFEYILFGKRGPIYKGIVYSLDDYANNSISADANLFGDLSVAYNYYLLDITLIDGERGYIKELAMCYHTNEKNIEDLLDMLNSYYECENDSDKENIKRLYYEKLSGILTNFFKNKENLTDLDRNILGSQIFMGPNILINNLFNDCISISYECEEYGLYDRYFDRIYGLDISKYVYREKLETLISEKGNNLDYNNPDSRFLIYLYLLCYKDNISYHNGDLVNCKTSEELADLIVKRLFDDEGFTTINPEFIYGYLTNGTINTNDLENEINLTDSFQLDALEIALGVEYINCLKKECPKENKGEDYLERDFAHLKYIDEDIYNLIAEALKKDESIFINFKMLPISQEYKSEKIKKYILKQE